jgi:hypothetical protein
MLAARLKQSLPWVPKTLAYDVPQVLESITLDFEGFEVPKTCDFETPSSELSWEAGVFFTFTGL